MVELWKSFSQLCREIYQEKTVRERKMIKKNSLKSFPLFFSPKIKLEFLNKFILKKNLILPISSYCLYLNTPKRNFWNFLIILPFSNLHFPPPENTHKTMVWMFRPTISLKFKIETTFKHQKQRYWSEVMKIHLNFDAT